MAINCYMLGCVFSPLEGIQCVTLGIFRLICEMCTRFDKDRVHVLINIVITNCSLNWSCAAETCGASRCLLEPTTPTIRTPSDRAEGLRRTYISQILDDFTAIGLQHDQAVRAIRDQAGWQRRIQALEKTLAATSRVTGQLK